MEYNLYIYYKMPYTTVVNLTPKAKHGLILKNPKFSSSTKPTIKVRANTSTHPTKAKASKGGTRKRRSKKNRRSKKKTKKSHHKKSHKKR